MSGHGDRLMANWAITHPLRMDEDVRRIFHAKALRKLMRDGNRDIAIMLGLIPEGTP